MQGSDLKDVKLYKILNSTLKHYDHQYTLGLNVLTGDFSPYGNCGAGGLYITDKPHRWIGSGTLIATVTLPDDAQVWATRDKYKVNKLILGEWKEISDEIYLQSVNEEGDRLEFIPRHRRTLSICLAAVNQDGVSLRHLTKEERTQTICLAAMEDDARAINFVPEHELSGAILDLGQHALYDFLDSAYLGIL